MSRPERIRFIESGGAELLEVAHQAALEVGRLVLVDIVFLGQLVDHTHQLRQELLRRCGVSHIAEVLDGSTSRLFVIAVA